jgi:hypothetical protein
MTEVAARRASRTPAAVRVVEEGRQAARRTDSLATEEPMETRVVTGGQARSVAVTMRTPGADFESTTVSIPGSRASSAPTSSMSSCGARRYPTCARSSVTSNQQRLWRMRQGEHRLTAGAVDGGDRGGTAAAAGQRAPRSARTHARGPAPLRRDRWSARRRPVHAGARAGGPARGRGPPQRGGQGRRLGAAEPAPAICRPGFGGQRPHPATRSCRRPWRPAYR